MPAVRFAVADRGHNASRLARLENDHDGIEACPFEIGIDVDVAAAFRGLRNRYVPLVRPLFQPALKLLANVVQHVSAHRVKLPIEVLKKPTTRSGCCNG
jgi:hypothetical protein